MVEDLIRTWHQAIQIGPPYMVDSEPPSPVITDTLSMLMQ